MEDFHITSKGKAKPANSAAKKSVALEHAKENKSYKPKGWTPEMLKNFDKADAKRDAKKWSAKAKHAHLKKEHEKFDER